jgi:hypothetical protein
MRRSHWGGGTTRHNSTKSHSPEADFRKAQ